jgi:hypothetical protein
MIMKVACFFDQHSPMLGQLASSQTVTSFFSRTSLWVSANTGEPGAFTRIHSGFLSKGVSGRFTFSGCRGLTFVVVSMSVAKGLCPALDCSIGKNKNTSAQDGYNQLADETSKPDAQQSEQEISDNRADNAKDDIHDESSIELHHLLSDPPGNAADDDRHDDSISFHSALQG